ncbi:ComEA family DNA-binding protein [Lactococcus termiticola]|uniref:Competence protein ComEA n=1 Tax=Lactococcus termiticola TaxID=2169526 RepID=A0A2R5HJD2_9LACT|nr:ComEA family DNA-binding protein [Lactococcus termiticola]GBG96670.1 competence protein ComEA [Lactococcus termiticola]
MNQVIEWMKEHLKLLALIGLGLIVVAGFLIFRSPRPSQEAGRLKPAQNLETKSSNTSSKTSGDEKVRVDLKGAVKRPGVYELSKNARVEDLIKLAGGLLDEADSKSINLAARLQDEAVIYVARRGEAVVAEAGQPAGSTTSKGKVNINTASLAELQTITGVGAKKAQDIIDYRTEHGKFQKLEDLRKVKGFGEKTIEKLKELIRLE